MKSPTPSKTTLIELETYLKKTFEAEWNVTDSAWNGIQLSNTQGISHLAVGVDFCGALIEQAIEAKCDGILVHHGMYWGAVEPLTGRRYEWIRKMIQHDIALVALHLPLDLHPVLGNNAGIIEALELEHLGNFGNYKGSAILFEAQVREEAGISFHELTKRYEARMGKPITTVQGHERPVKRIGICSGGGLFGIEAAYQQGCEAYLTGDANHTTYHLAKELPINLISGGHYNTEVLGVQRLAHVIKQDLGAGYTFFDIPTEL